MVRIFFAIAAIVWTVIKALSKAAPKQPVPRPRVPGLRPAEIPVEEVPAQPRLRPQTMQSSQPYFAEQPETVLEVEDLDAEGTGGFQPVADLYAQGIVMSEILSAPRCKRLHSLLRR